MGLSDFDIVDLLGRTKLEARPYQQRLIQKSMAAYTPKEEGGKGLRSVMIESPTGCLTGDAVVGFNSGGKSFTCTLAEAYIHWHGGDPDAAPGTCACGCGRQTRIRIRTITAKKQMAGAPIRFINGHQSRAARWNNGIKVRGYRGEHGLGLIPVLDIVRSGVKKVYKLTLSDGKTLRGTADHPILTPTGWRAITALAEGDSVLTDRRRPGKSAEHLAKPRDTFIWNLWNHPYGRRVRTNKEARGYTIRVPVHVAVYEAATNNLTMDEYVRIMRHGDPTSLELVDPAVNVIHHRDNDHYNNDRGNLELMTAAGHNEHHGRVDFYRNFGNSRPETATVVSVKESNEEMTYDICCERPYHNFVANGIVVHNSGKTSLSLLIIKALQDLHQRRGQRLNVGWVSMRRFLLEQAARENINKAVNADVMFISMFDKNLPQELLHREGSDPNIRRMLVVDECLPYDSSVEVIDNGQHKRVPIGDVVTAGVGSHVLSRSDEGTLEYKPIVSRTPMGVKELLEIVVDTADGTFVLPITAEGRVWTTDGYVRAGDLRPGSVMCCLSRCPAADWQAYQQPEKEATAATDSRDAVGRRLYRSCGEQDRQQTPGNQPALQAGARHSNPTIRGTVVGICNTGRYVETYDIGVAENHNFFADGMLVHNCQHDAANSMTHIHSRVRPDFTLGMTATPYRSDHVKLCFDTVLKDAGLAALIKDGYLAPYHHYTIPEWSVKKVVQCYLREPKKWGKSIFYFHTIVQCQQAARLLTRGGIRVEVVTANSNREEQLESFRAGTCDVLVNCMVLIEGFDCPDLKTVFCRPSCKGVTTQMCLDSLTEVLTEAGWRTHKTISPDDLAAGFDCDTGEISWVPIDEIIKRPVADAESFRVIKGPHLDVRVTDQHDLVYRSRNRLGTHRSWLKDTAGNLHVNRSQPFLVPVAGIASSAGIDLTDAELVLLGLYLTDGCYCRKALSIAQAADSDQLPAIEAAFGSCGLRPWRGEKKRTGRLARYAPCITYTVGIRQLTSAVPNLRRYIEAGKTQCLVSIDELTPDQLAKVLIGMQIGDGRKHRNVDYTSHTYALCLGNDYGFIDKFQALCVRKGFRCNLSYYRYPPNDWNKAGEHGAVVHVKRQPYSTVCGTTVTDAMSFKGQQRTQIDYDEATPGEQVWCIRNRLGTIITRRNGKVTIVGNCGRAFRKHPDVPYKQIVQAKKGWPFIKLAVPQQQYTWDRLDRSDDNSEMGWLSLTVNPHINELNCKMIITLAGIETKMPDYINKKALSARGRARRRRI